MNNIGVSILSDSRLKCTGYIMDEGGSDSRYQTLSLEIEKIKEISMSTFQKNDVICIKVRTAGQGNANYMIYLPGITEIDNLKSNIQAVLKSKQRIAETEKQRQLEIEEKKIKSREYYAEQFLAIQEKYPLYILEKNDDIVAFMYINENKDLFIKSIDKIQMESIESVILYKDIHYYEKAGNIHYVSNIDINYSDQSFAGSFVSGKV